MSYKTNPIANRLGITKGWTNTKFVTKNLDQQVINQKYFKLFCLLKKKLEFYNWRLCYVEPFFSKNKKIILVNSAKIKYKKTFKNRKLWRRKITTGSEFFVKTKAIRLHKKLNLLPKFSNILHYCFIKKFKNKTKQKFINKRKLLFVKWKNFSEKNKISFGKWKFFFKAEKLIYRLRKKRKRRIFYVLKHKFSTEQNIRKKFRFLFCFRYLRKLTRKTKASNTRIYKKIWKILPLRRKAQVTIKNNDLLSYKNFIDRASLRYKTKQKNAALLENLGKQGKNKEFRFFRKSLKIAKLNFILSQFLENKLKINCFIKFFRITKMNFLKKYFFKLSLKRPKLRRYRKNSMFIRMLPLMYLFSRYKNATPLTLQMGVEFEKRTKHWPIIRSYREFFRQIASKTLYGWRISIRGKINKAARARSYVIGQGPIPLQQFFKRVDYTFLPADAKTGSFSIKIHNYH